MALAIVYFCTFISKKKDETVPCFFAKYPILKSTIFQPRVFNIKVTIASGYRVLSFFQISLQYSSSITILQKQKSREYSAYILIQHTTCNRPLNVPLLEFTMHYRISSPMTNWLAGCADPAIVLES